MIRELKNPQVIPFDSREESIRGYMSHSNLTREQAERRVDKVRQHGQTIKMNGRIYEFK